MTGRRPWTRKPDESDSLRKWVRIFNKNYGFPGSFNYETADDRRTVEMHAAREWCRSLAVEFGVDVGPPQENLNDPPDCHVEYRGNRLGVEMVQLIEQAHVERAATGETPYAGKLFNDMQWSKDRFARALNDVVRQKGEKYSRRGLLVDVLVIYTGEKWLNPEQAQGWLEDNEIEPHSNIFNAFLMFDYEPRGDDRRHWPMFFLFGSLLSK